MSYYRVVGDGPSAAEPLEQVEETAAGALSTKHRLQRLCGRAGKVTIWGKDGRVIGDSKIARLAREEASSPEGGAGGDGSSGGI